MKKVKGIGGIFFKCKDPDGMKNWYSKHLGMETNEYGAVFEFRAMSNPDKRGYLQWSTFKEETTYLEPSEKPFMVNYRVENLEELLKELVAEGVQVVGKLESFEYGKFAHIMDPEGHKIELWEPIDEPFTELYDGKTNHE